MLRNFLRLRPDLVLSAMFLATIIAVAMFPSIVTSQDPFAQNLTGRLQPPGSIDPDGVFHLLGTDPLGRDLLARLVLGTRVSFLVLLGVMPISAALGVTLGLLGGYFGGWLDVVVNRLIDVRLSIPFILVLLTVMAVIGPSLVNMIIVLGAMQWVDYAKLARAEALSLRERDFILSTRASGARQGRILLRHMLPNVSPTIIVVMTLEAPHLILTEAALSFLGLGVSPQTPSWGQMLSNARDYVFLMPAYAAFPGLAITLTVLAFNVAGDALRDYFDPFLRSR